MVREIYHIEALSIVIRTLFTIYLNLQHLRDLYLFKFSKRCPSVEENWFDILSFSLVSSEKSKRAGLLWNNTP